MVNLPQSQPAVLSDLLQFRCKHCFQALQVPMSYAGQSAPCPFCHEITVAPQQSAVKEPLSAVTAHKPPIRFSCPCCQQGLTVPIEFAGVKGPCCFCGTVISAPDRVDHKENKEIAVTSPPHSSTAHLDSPNTGAIANETTLFPVARKQSRAPGLNLGQSPSPPARTPKPGKILTRLAIGALTFGVAVATVFFAGPGRYLFIGKETRPDADDVLRGALATRAQLKANQNRAITDASSCIHRFLTASDWSEASDYAVGVPQAALGSKMPSITRAGVPNLTFHSAQRRPGTKAFRVKHWLDRGPGLAPAAVWVEETGNGPRVRWDLLEQQLSGRLRHFQGSESAPPTRFYARLQAVDGDQNPFSELSGLSDATVVAVSSALTHLESEPFYAISIPGSNAHAELASLFATSNSTEGWISASRTENQSGINYITINALEIEGSTSIQLPSQTKRNISTNYGNSGIQ